MIVPHEAYWFRCTICAERWPASQCAGRLPEAGMERICTGCASLIEGEGVVA